MKLYCPKTGEKTEWPEKLVEVSKGCFYEGYACEDCEDKCVIDVVFARLMTPEAIRDSEMIGSGFADMVAKLDRRRVEP